MEIQTQINKLLEKRTDFQLTSISLIKMMVDSGDCEGELQFYIRINEAILNRDKSLSFDEKEQFLILYKALINIYKNETR